MKNSIDADRKPDNSTDGNSLAIDTGREFRIEEKKVEFEQEVLDQDYDYTVVVN